MPASSDNSPAHDVMALLELIGDAYIVLDHEYRFTYANPAAERDMKKTLAELRGRVHWEVFPASYDITAGRHYRAAVETREPQYFREHYRYEGYDIHMDMAAYPTASGGVAVIWRDISAQVKAEAQLRAREAELARSEARLRAVIEAVPVGVFEADMTGRVITINQQAKEMFGGAHFVEGVEDYHLYRGYWTATGEPIAPTEWALARALLRGEHCPGERIEIERFDGGRRSVLNHAAPIFDADGVQIGAVAAAVDITAQVEADAAREHSLRVSEERYALAARATNNAIWEWDLATGRLAWSEGLTGIFGIERTPETEHADWWLAGIHPDDRARVIASVHVAIEQGADTSEWRDTYRFRRGNGEWADVLDRGFVARDATGRATRMIGAMEDVTAQRHLEEQLRQAQKMEAVGQLAGGVAHDFNNLLTVISGNLEFLRADLAKATGVSREIHEEMQEIWDAVDRARSLVRQLLTFSRRQPVRPQQVQLGAIVLGAEKLLRRLIGEEIVLSVAIADEDWCVEADPSQLEQVLMNLAVNARDSMLTPLHGHAGRGGALTLEVDALTLAPADLPAWSDGAPGTWVRLRVRDTGHGMDPATQAHLFEPFFTTKAVGLGTGLGLSTVFGIARQAGGLIRVESTPGHGTTFTLLFPALRPDTARPAQEPPVPRVAATATLLLVEDETALRATVRRILERFGYRVLEARHGADAVLIWREHAAEIELVVSDMRMPELGGRELVAILRSERPSLPVVFMSGYPDHETTADAMQGMQFLPKPFTAEELIQAVDLLLRNARAARDA